MLIKFYKTKMISMFSQQIFSVCVLWKIEGGNKGRACIVIDSHFHILSRGSTIETLGFWEDSNCQNVSCGLLVAVIRVGSTLLIPPKNTAIQIPWKDNKLWTKRTPRCEQTWFVWWWVVSKKEEKKPCKIWGRAEKAQIFKQLRESQFSDFNNFNMGQSVSAWFHTKQLKCLLSPSAIVM